jgi:ABC-type transport system substrate-binding protein
VRIVYPSHADDAVPRQLQAAGRSAGIEIRLEPLERGLFTRKKNERDFDGLYLAWVLDVEEDPYFAWHSRFARDGANYSGFRAADALVEEARATADPALRRKLLKRLQARIDAEQPVLFVQAATMLVAWQPRLAEVKFHPLKPPGWDICEWRLVEALHGLECPR